METGMEMEVRSEKDKIMDTENGRDIPRWRMMEIKRGMEIES